MGTLGFSSRRAALMALSLAGIMLMALIDVFIANIAAPSIGRDLNVGGGALQLVVAGYALTYGTALLVGARLGDHYGRRRLALAGIALFGLASALCGAAPSMAWLVAGRLAQGVGAALMVPQVLAVISSQFGEGDRKLAMGIYGAAIGLGSILGQLLGGALISADWANLGWRLVFFVNLPMAVLVFCGIGATVREERGVDAGERFDRRAAALWCLALCGLGAAPLLGRSLDWSPVLLAVAGVGALAGFLFVGHERARKRDGRPGGLLDPAIASYRSLREALAVLFLMQACLAAFLFVFVLTFQDGLGRSAAQAGYTLIVPGLAFAIVSLLRYRAAPASTPRDVTTLGFIVAALGFLALGTFGLLAGEDRFGLLATLPTLLACGIGLGFGFAPSADRAVASVPEALTGTAAGLVATTLQVANVAGVAIVGAIFFAFSHLAGGSRRAAAVAGFSETLLVVAGLLIAWCAFVSWRGARLAYGEVGADQRGAPAADQRGSL
jgi:MFS family permease